jgi:hypothetical protein
VSQLPVIVLGVFLAGWGQLLLLERSSVVDAWYRMDSMFPPSLRSSPTFAGYTMLVLGARLALVPLLA